MQPPLAVVGSLSAFMSWWFDRGLSLLVGGVLLLLIIPFTLVVILPTNKRLESQELDLGSKKRTISCDVGADFMRFAAS